MAETTAPLVNGLDLNAEIKSEPVDPLIDSDGIGETPAHIIPKEFTHSNGLHEDSDCEDISYFTQTEVDNTRKCLENTRLIIKDFETQLDWHLQQYMTLRNVFNKKKDGKDDKRQDLLSISQLSAIIANHPEGNKKFIKRKGPVSNGAGGRKRRRGKESESEEESDFSDDSEEYDEDFDENDSEGVDDPSEKPKKKARGRKKGGDGPQIKEEFEEEEHELIEPKQEMASDEEMGEAPKTTPTATTPTAAVKKTPAKRGRKPAEGKTPAKRGRGKKAAEAVDLTDLKTCSVVLNRVGEDDSQDSMADVKDEELDRDEIIEMLQFQAIKSIDKFRLDSEKPIVILKEDNVKDFDWNECKTSNVIATFEDIDNFPEFIFMRDVTDRILDGSMIFVQGSVFDQHLSAENEKM